MLEQSISYLTKNQDLIIAFGLKLLVAIVIFYIGRWVALGASQLVSKALLLRKVDRAVVSFIASILYAAVLIAFALIALSHLGIQTASFIAILGAAGLAVALALQGSLSNFASGVLIIVFRPFKAGDFVEVAGISGVIERIDIFQTIFKTADNKKIIVPNSQITGGAITNYSAEKRRRAEKIGREGKQTCSISTGNVYIVRHEFCNVFASYCDCKRTLFQSLSVTF